jgi:hypothetical protein
MMLARIHCAEPARPSLAAEDERPRSNVVPREPGIAPIDGGVAAQLAIERITGWPDVSANLIDHAKWLAQTGGSYALATAGITEVSKRVVYRPDSPIALRMTREMLVSCGGLRYSDADQNAWYVCGSKLAADRPEFLALSFCKDGLAMFRPESVGQLSTKSADVRTIVRGQNTLAAVELLIWLVRRSKRFSSWGFGISPVELLAALGRRRQSSRADLLANLDDILSVVREIKLQQVYLPANSWQFASACEESAVRICRERNEVSVVPSAQLPALLRGILPELSVATTSGAGAKP